MRRTTVGLSLMAGLALGCDNSADETAGNAVDAATDDRANNDDSGQPSLGGDLDAGEREQEADPSSGGDLDASAHEQEADASSGDDLDAGEHEQEADPLLRDDGGNYPDASTLSSEGSSGEDQPTQDGGSGPGGPSAETREHPLFEYWRFICDARRACCSENGFDRAGLAFCEDRYASAFTSSNLGYFTEHASVVISETGVQACLEALSDAYSGCSEASLFAAQPIHSVPRACDAVFVGTIDDDEPCRGDFECRGDGRMACLVVDDGTELCGASPYGSEGDYCNAHSRPGTSTRRRSDWAEGTAHCRADDGVYCDFNVGLCASHQSEGSECESDFECAIDQHCQNGACADLLTVGEPCEQGRHCASGWCHDQTNVCADPWNERRNCEPDVAGAIETPQPEGDETPGEEDGGASTQPTWLVGHWKSPCLPFQDLHYIGEMTFDATRFVSVQNFFTDSQCTEHLREFIDEGYYQLGPEVETPSYGKATELDLQYDGIGARYTLVWSDGDELRFGDANSGSTLSEDERSTDMDPVHHMLRQ